MAKNKAQPILLVEDNPEDTHLLQDMLVDADKQAFKLTCVDSLRAAEKHLNEENINAVLLDLSLPDGSGLETLQKMVKIAPKTPIIVLTDTEDENLAVKAMQTGAQDYLVKGHVDGALLVRSIRYSIERKRIQEYLVSNESRYRILTENVSDVIWTMDLNLHMTDISPSIVRQTGYTPEETLKQPMEKLLTTVSYQHVLEVIAEETKPDKLAVNLEDPFWARTLELEYIRKDGSTFWAEVKVSLLTDSTNQPTGIMGITRDITDRKRTEESLHRREAILEAVNFAAEKFLKAADWEPGIEEVLARLGEAALASRIYIYENKRGDNGEVYIGLRYEWVASDIEPQIDNPLLQKFPLKAGGFERWIGILKHGEVIHGHIREFPISEQLILVPQSIQSILLAPIFVDDKWWGMIGFDECLTERVWPQVEINALQTAAGILGAAIQRKHAEEELRYLATHDPLTDLPNRVLFLDRLRHALDRAQRNRGQLAVLLLDLDQFKRVNDTLGHAKGDMVLEVVADRLKKSMRRSDTIARMGGDEFIILLEEVNSPTDCAIVAQKILDLVGIPYIIEGNEFQITGSIGICVYPRDGESVENLLMRADIAMYRAKKKRNRFWFYSGTDRRLEGN